MIKKRILNKFLPNIASIALQVLMTAKVEKNFLSQNQGNAEIEISVFPVNEITIDFRFPIVHSKL